MTYKLTAKEKRELRAVDNDQLATIVPLFAAMDSHPWQVTDKPGRLGAVSREAATILAERGH